MVVYFPKRAPAAPPAFEDSGTVPLTQPIELGAHVAPTDPEQRPKLAKPKRGGGKKLRRVSRRTKTPIAVNTLPALRYHAEKVKAVRAGAPKDLVDLSLQGHRLFEEGHWDEARQVFERLVSSGVTDAFPHSMLGTIYLAQGKLDRALALFEAALALDPKDLAARVYRAELWINSGNTKPALTDLLQIVARGPVTEPFVERAHRLIEIAKRPRNRKKR